MTLSVSANGNVCDLTVSLSLYLSFPTLLCQSLSGLC